ncbi:phospholipid binding protein [Legionella lansingensis]|uniref:Phospholipid binding protein n=2 Tax=Legionella lansingensis TaxID=45067 RepID=A0A0W0VXQ4_9GAMM|nr:phospholipid binding protein [Legionella lansingensis]SNV53562.1 phospholipid binding protein [Legionella lansingensis]
MRRYIQVVLVGALFVLIASCQMISSPSIFNPRLSDQAITNSVYQAFADSKILSDVPVHVETHQGNVLLSGYVKTIRQSDTAQDVATKVPGVRGVQNNIIVRK